MHSDLLLDAVRDSAHKGQPKSCTSLRSAWADRARRAVRHLRAARADVDVPAQQRREAVRETAGVGETAR
jgi:hypothetical protein